MNNLQAYQATLQRVAYFHQTNAGFFRLSGADRLDFIQRQSTNDLRQLTSEQIVLTVLTSPTARILDVLCLLDEGESLGVIPLPGRQEQTTQFLRSRIFFSDQVTVTDASAGYSQVFVVGPQAQVILESLGIQPPPLNHLSTAEIDDQRVIVIAREIFAAVNYHLLLPPASLDFWLAALSQRDAQPLDEETFEILRVESGEPGTSAELISDYTPLEVGLQKMISGSKGCYTGQEIIARQVTYDKITKHLVGLKVDERVGVGASILVDAKSVGTVTSVAQSPRFGHIALGVVRRPHAEPGSNLVISSASGASIPARVADLPFA